MPTTIKEARIAASFSIISFLTLFYPQEQRKSTLRRVEMELDEADEMVNSNGFFTIMMTFHGLL